MARELEDKQNLFRRMESSKRGAELRDFLAIRREIYKAAGWGLFEYKPQVWIDAAEKFHPTDPKEFPEDNVVTQRIREQQAAEEERSVEEVFNAAVLKLPDRADEAVEDNWMRAHPAMRRLDRNGGKTVVLTLADIEDAPSKYAVNSLQRWANDPREYNKICKAADRKAMIDRGDSLMYDETESDLSGLKDMLREFGKHDH